MRLNGSAVLPARFGKGTQEYGPNYWRATGHCRRCDNGKFHSYHRRGAGGEHPSGVILQRLGGNIYEDEITPGEKPALRRKARRRNKREMMRVIRDEN